MLVFAALCATLSALPASALPGVWHRDARDEHPVHKLFPRQASFPTVGSAEWTAKYPAGPLTVANTPKAWLDALKAAEDAGKIPKIPRSVGGAYTSTNGSRLDPAGDLVCSSAAQCRGDDQVYDVPDGVVAISFDDGPLPASRELYKFLKEQKQSVTHFFIGANILENPQIFLEAFNEVNDDMAVHTWSHPEMTTLSNELVAAELGWTMQIIHDSTGGRLPRYWRPSYGDSDNRVRAIAREIFGLTTVIWNADTDDWDIGKSQTRAAAKKVLTDAYAGPKSPGLNILEHELNKDCVDIFIETYPLIKQNGWEPKSIPDALGQAWYLNAVNNVGPVTERLVYGGPNGTVQAGSGGSSASASSTETAGASNPTNPTTGSNAGNGALGLSAGGWSLAALVAAFALI